MTPIGRRILANKYEVIHEIKQGGFGIVYYGLDSQLNKPVAIKEIAPTLLEDPKYLDMFQEEALNIAKLSHNNIVHIYEFFKSPDGRLYIIMEYIDGKDLEKIVRVARKTGKPIPQHLAVYIVAEICAALDYAHQRRDAFTNKPLNLVHQDISPSNIMISRFGVVKLIDFGIAAVKRHQTKDRRDRKLRGKIPYMSPEQLLVANQPDHRSDLFSLGLVLYEILTGARIFKTQEDIIAAGKNHKWLKKLIKTSRLPSPLERILSRALELDLNKRYQSANHMYIDLLQYLMSCNQGGEMMDDLADYVQNLFETSRPMTPNLTPNTWQPPVQNQPVPNSSPRPLVPNRWAAGTEARQESHTYRRPEVAPPQPRAAPPPAEVHTVELGADDEDDADDIKTVIDVIRLSARNHKRHLIQFAMSVLILGVIFGLLDTINGWTPAGTWMYDWLFPPAIEIVTVPPNAKVMVDDQEISGQTPVAIEKISPGVHKLELHLAGFKPIVKSLFVPRDGAVRVQGEATNGGQRSYLFRFNAEIEIDSQPEGATVYLNEIRYNQKTPCTILWEVGKPLEIQLERAGFQSLTGYSLNTLEQYDVVDDRRFWQMEVSSNSYTKYWVKGVFRKNITFRTRPAGVEIYDLETNNLLGVTGVDTRIAMMAGEHTLEFRKANFISQTQKLIVDENAVENMDVVLSRRVRFTAFDKADRARQDIGARIAFLRRANGEVIRPGRNTPLEITLPAYSYTAKLQKTGYENADVAIGPEDRTIGVAMEVLKANLEIQVLDAVSGQPVRGAEIYYNYANSPVTADIFFDQTDGSGAGFGQLAAGDYHFSIKKTGYSNLRRLITAISGETHRVVFKLYLAN